ncbi:MAG: hypothetical protein J2P28_00470 [Actinobacteria bacterium]|nr:hypothetical protein [Actinomycetota bacterium]
MRLPAWRSVIHTLNRLPELARASPLRATAVVAVAAAGICAMVFGFSWLGAAGSTPLSVARTRDAALQAAEQAAVNLNTLDYRHARSDLNLWLDSSTGALHKGIAQDLQQEMQVAQQQKLVTSATVLDGAVTRLDVGSGTANVMLAMTFKVQVSGSRPASKFESELGTVRKTPAGWRLASLCPTSGCANATPTPSTSP